MTMPLVEALATDPHPILRDLRRSQPVCWVDELDVWLVTSHELCREVIVDDETFTVDDPRFSTREVIGPSMLSLDGDAHRRHREPFAPSLRSREVRRLETFLEARAKELLREVSRAGRGDLRADVAGPLAVSAMARVLDLADVDVGDLLGWYQSIVDAVHMVTIGDEVPETGRRAFKALHEAVARNLSRSLLLGSVDSSGALSTDEIVSNVAVLLFGGVVTAESSTAIAFADLLGDDALRARLAEDRHLVGPFVEESFRLEPSAAVVDRYATRSVRIGGVTVAEGDLVRVSLSAANRDPLVFSEPDRFDIGRDDLGRSLTFARGPHACLGIHLARLETRVAVNALLDSGSSLQLDGEAPVSGLVFRSPDEVSVVEAQ